MEQFSKNGSCDDSNLLNGSIHSIGTENLKYREPSLLRDFPERTFSVSFLELCESDGLFWIFDNECVAFDGDVWPSLVSF